MLLLEIFKLTEGREMPDFHWISEEPESLMLFSSFTDQVIQICNGNHREDAGKNTWAKALYYCKGLHNVWGKILIKRLTVLLLAHHTLLSQLQ